MREDGALPRPSAFRLAFGQTETLYRAIARPVNPIPSIFSWKVAEVRRMGRRRRISKAGAAPAGDEND